MFFSPQCKCIYLLFMFILFLSACSDEKTPSEPLAAAQDDTALEHALKHMDAKYVCPMHSQIIRDEPGSCPICGMDLVLKQIDMSEHEGPNVKVSGAIQQAMNIRTAKIKRDTLWKYIKTVGMVQYDEDSLVHVHPRAAGWVEKLYVHAEGEPVTRGKNLLEIYAPDILDAQVDFLIALKQVSGRAVSKTQVNNARNRLRLLEVPESIIKRIQNDNSPHNTVPMLVPQTGVITHFNIREGMYVTPPTEMFTIADLSSIWVIVEVFEQQIAWVEKGKSAEITVPAYPGKSWEGKVDYLYPELDPKTRTLRVRLRFPNPDGLLKPDMFAQAAIYGGPKRDALVVPNAALIVTGKRTAVIKVEDDGVFKPVDVVLGMQHGDKAEVLSGLNAGDEIVVSGQFLIDSEANIQASFARLAQ